VRRGALVAAGSVFVVLGVVGTFLPLLPTTPFLLLAAACYVRSSDRLYDWLLENRVLGKYLRSYRAREGIPLTAKIATLALLWVTLGASALYALPPRLWWIDLVLLAVGLGVTFHLVRLPTRPRDRDPAQGSPP